MRDRFFYCFIVGLVGTLATCAVYDPLALRFNGTPITNDCEDTDAGCKENDR